MTHVLVLLVLRGRFFGPLFVTQRPTVIKTAGDYLLDNDNLSQDAQMALSPPFHGPRTKAARHPSPMGLAGAALAVLVAQTATTSADEPGSLDACLKAVAQSDGPEISCNYKTLLTEGERADMQRLTRGLLQDASCLIKVTIARDLVEPALTKDDHIFEATPQPVTCEIKTKDGGFPISATFAPKVMFKGGSATEGTPGLGNVTGVNKYLAWPVVEYVNRAPGIRKSMLEIINRYRAALAAARKRQ